MAIGVTLLALSGCGSSGPEDDPLIVGAASSLRTALAEYQGEEDSLEPVRVSFAGSDLIASQIRQGAGIDVIAAASTADPTALYKDGLAERPVEYARNEVVIAVPTESDIDAIEDLEKPGLDIVIGDDAVPVGTYARKIIGGLPTQTGDAIEQNVRSEEPDVSSITAKLVQGAADAGFIYATDVLSAPEDIKAVEIPETLQPTVVYSAAVVSDSPRPEDAARYIDDLLSGTGAEDLEEAGFLPAP